MVTQVTKIIESQKTKYGETYAKDLEAGFIAKYIGSLALLSLTKFSGTRTKSKSEYDLAAASFSELKVTVQEAVAAAFSVAMTEFSGRPVDYFCTLQMIAEGNNKVQH